MLLVISAAAGVWDYEFHPEVWVLVAALVGLGVYAVRVIGPLAVTDGSQVVSRVQKYCFFVGVALLWLSADWPMHDIAEENLYFVHMLQHLLISFMVPPLLLLAMPDWLARLLVVDEGITQRTLRWLTRPLVAGVLFNLFQVITHWGAVVDLSVRNGAFHFGLHLAVFFSALLMWFPVLGPLKEMHMTEPGKMMYMFAMSIVPTVPAGWLTFAEGIVYPSYDTGTPLWGISPVHDQQAAGAVMKILGGFFLWTLIAIRFFRHVGDQRSADLKARREAQLTYADFERETRA